MNNFKIFYIVDKATWLKHIGYFHPQYGSHGIDLPDGRILILCNFHEESNILIWEANSTVEPLPDPKLEGNKPIEDKHVTALAHLGIKKNHTVLDVAKAAGEVNCYMKLSKRF